MTTTTEAPVIPEPDPTELPAVDFTESWGYAQERADYSD